ncbi:MAG: hypothetical protein AAFR14_08090, partial [Bacteroidota bacterium]
ALTVQTLHVLDRKAEARRLAMKIAEQLNESAWYTTHTIAQALHTVAKYGDKSSGMIEATLTLEDQNSQTVSYDKGVFTFSLDPDQQMNQVKITNTSEEDLFVSLQLSGQPTPEDVLTTTPQNKNVSINVKYQDLNGEPIDISRLEQGIDFYAMITVNNLNTRGPRLQDMALRHIIPSGWEIRSGRLSGPSPDSDAYDYRDVRDDRIYTFFDLEGAKTFSVLLNAAYEGRFFLPPVQVEAMYDGDIKAQTYGQMIQVTRSSGL